MPGNDNDIGGRVGLDVTDFKAGIAELNRQIRVIDTGFKAAAAGMGDWGKSAEGLQSRINSLNQVTDLQRKKIEGLTAEYKRIAAEKGADSKAAQDLQIRINKETEALNKNQLELKKTADALDNFGKETDQASDKTGKFTDKLKTIGGGIGKAAATSVVALGAATASAAVGAFSLAEKASNLSEAQNVVKETFDDTSASVLDWSKTVDESAGISETNTVKFVGSMGAMLKSSGLSEEASKDMSESLVQLTGDMSSFYNLGHDEMWEKIRSGISGETEPLKALGINMSVANMEAYALSQGIDKSWNSMSQAEQTTLRYGYLMQATADAQGDFGRTLETSFPNQMRVAQMQMESMATTIGQKMLPSFLEIFKAINTGFRTGDWSQVGTAISEGLTSAIGQLTAMAPQFVPVAVTILTGIINALITSIPQVLPALIQMTLQFLNVLIQTFTLNGPLLIQAGIDAIMMLLNGLLQALPHLVEMAVTLLLALVNKLIEMLPELIPVAIQMIVTIIQGLINALPQLIAMLPIIIQTIVNVLVQNLPMLVDAALQIMLALTVALIQNLPLIIKATIEIIGALLGGLVGGIVQVVAFVPKLFAALIGAFGNIQWGQLGLNIITGITTGVKNAAWRIADGAVQAAKNALQAVKNFLGISSPSAVMRDQVGLQIGAGMAEGIGDSTKMVSAAMRGLNARIVANPTFNTTPGPAQIAPLYIDIPVMLDGQIITKSTSRHQYSQNNSKARAKGVIPAT